MKGDLDPILPTMRFRIGEDEYVISRLDDEAGIVTTTRLRDGRILKFTTLELRDGYHVEWIEGHS